MYGDDSRDLGTGPHWLDEELEGRTKSDEEDEWENSRPRIVVFAEDTFAE